MSLRDFFNLISRNASKAVNSAKGERGASPLDLFLLAVCFGLLTGIGEVAILSVKKFFLHRFIFLSPHVVWMSPLANLFIFSFVGLAVALIAWRWPGRFSLRAGTFLISLLGFLGLLLTYPKLHHYATFLVATGLAVQVSRLITARASSLHSFIRRTTVWILSIVLALAAIMHGWYWLAENRAQANLPSAQPGTPNVLLIVLDTVRAKSLSHNDRSITPNLEQLAQTGVIFERALSTAPWTTASHASMFTGRLPHELSVNRTGQSADGVAPLDATYSTIAEVLSRKGYVTAGFVANVDYCGYETGLNRGFLHYQDYLLSPQEILLSSSLSRSIANSHKFRKLINYYDVIGRQTADKLNTDFLSWLPRNDQRPFFAFLNYYDAHEPYLPPPPYDTRFGSATPRVNSLIVPWGIRQAKRHDKELMSATEIGAELDAYEGSIAYMDHYLGELLKELKKRGALENTLVIVTSDHGELFGEHGLFEHGHSLYMPLLHVPLLISWPSHVPAGVKIPDPASLLEIPATVLDLIGQEGGADFPTGSLKRFWRENPDGTAINSPLISEVSFLPRVPAHHPISKGDMKSIVAGRYHYVLNGDGAEELYDFEEDPSELKNLAASKEGQIVLVNLRDYLKTSSTEPTVRLESGR